MTAGGCRVYGRTGDAVFFSGGVHGAPASLTARIRVSKHAAGELRVLYGQISGYAGTYSVIG